MPAAAAMRSGVGADGVLLARQSRDNARPGSNPPPPRAPPRHAATHAQTSPRLHPRSDLAAATYPQTSPPPMASAHAPALSPPLHSLEEKRREETHVDRTTRSSGGQIHPPRSARARAPPTTRPCPCVKDLDGDASAPQWPWSFLPIQGLGLDGDGCSSKIDSKNLCLLYLHKGTMMNFTDDALVKKSSVLLTRMESITAYENQRGQPRSGTLEQSDTPVSANDMCSLVEWPSHARRNRALLQDDQLQAECANTQERINLERAEREQLEERLKEKRDERERFLEEERTSRLEFEKNMMAKFAELSQ